MARREFLLLADTFKESKGHDPIGMVASEKLDGARVLWDGGVSRGDGTVNVPWANVYDPKKPTELKGKIKPKATGLWSRYGNPIQAPDWFLDQLPPQPLDGELYISREKFQETMSAIRKDVPVDEEWRKVQFIAFGAPSTESVFQTGLIKNPQMVREITVAECQAYYVDRGYEWDCGERTYADELCLLEEMTLDYAGDVFNTVYTETIKTHGQLDNWLKSVKAGGGEGLMIREPDSVWFPKRRPSLLKVKPRHDAEATIVGFIAGKRGKTGHLLGKIGTLVCVWHGDPTAPCGLLKAPVEFEIGTGLNYDDREVHPDDVEAVAATPGERVDCCTSMKFQLGQRVTFTYMDVSKDMVPREPSYQRVRQEV